MTAEPSHAGHHDDDLGRHMSELERARTDALCRIAPQGAWRTALLATAGVGFWVWNLVTGDPHGLGDLIWTLLAAVAGGYAWAAHALNQRYRRRYKAAVVPILARPFGELAWTRARPDLDALRRHRLFPAWESCEAEDQIVGAYRGLPVSIIEMKLTRSEGENEVTVFQGLTADVTLPRPLQGLTLVLPDRGVFGAIADRFHGGPCQAVDLEDPDFAAAYRVYATDQIVARALLTPAFMTRFLSLARSARFGSPAALVKDDRLMVALATGDRKLFVAPGLLQPAPSREVMDRLVEDLRTMLSATDAVIDLDQAARSRAEAPA